MPGARASTASGCKTTLSQGCYRWQHSQVLRKLPEVLEGQRQEASRGHSPPLDRHIRFIREGEGSAKTALRALWRSPWTSPLVTQDCNMRVDLGRKLQFPTEITSTSLPPHIVLWSSSTKSVLLIELTILWEAGVEAAWERKRLKYSDFV